LLKEITSLDKDYLKQYQFSKEIIIVCPKCEFDGFALEAAELDPDPCPIHGGSTIRFDYFPTNGEKYCKDYDLWSLCCVDDCDVVYNVSKKPLTCPNPTCDYVGPFRYELYKTLDSYEKAKILNNRKHSLIQKHNDMVELLRRIQHNDI